jgi:ribosome-binding factor A
MRPRTDTKDRKGGSIRLLRVGEEIRHILSDVLARGHLRDDVLDTHSITVSQVKVSPDLRHATVFVEPLGGADEAAVLEALNRHARALKGQLGRQLTTKYIPDLAFRTDDTFANAMRIDALLRSPKVARDLERPAHRSLADAAEDEE